MEDIMTTLPTTHRPTTILAAAAVAAAIGAGALAVSLSQSSGQPGAPSDQPRISVQQTTPPAHHFHPTTSGGHVLIGE